MSTPAPTSTGRVETEGLSLYYETHGDDDAAGASGAPVVLLHGGVLNVALAWSALIPVLSQRHRVIALDQQGHGRSTDNDREIRPETLARDVVALLDHLGIERAHVVGHSMGAAVAYELAVHHGDRLLSIAALSGSVTPEGQHPDFASPEAMATSTRMPTADDFSAMVASYAELSPTPDGFDAFMAKMQDGERFYRGWSDEELASIAVPCLHVLGDHDFTTVAHGEVMLEKVPGSTLAVLPGTTHMQVTARVDLLDPLLEQFLR